MIELNPNRTDKLIEQLADLWEKSVRASHHFLTNEDIEKLNPLVKAGVSSIETLVVNYDADTPIAFMGLSGNKIEMLFVMPDYFGKSIGKELVRYAIENHNARYVDVNEQNPSALGFYKHLGFTAFDRTELDEQGNPFPILKMRLEKGHVMKIISNKKQCLDLLLLADEQESMIDRYLERGEMFAFDDGGVKAVCVVTDEGNGVCELKNIAVTPDAQRQGYGKRLISYLIAHYSGKYIQMIVGTGDVPSATGFYESCGFKYDHRIENFFIDNYDHLMYENGVLLKDMVYLKRHIK